MEDCHKARSHDQGRLCSCFGAVRWVPSNRSASSFGTFCFASHSYGRDAHCGNIWQQSPPARCLTIHSSRRRFAARLNSGVRPLKAMLTQLRQAVRRRNSPTGSSVGFLAHGANLAQRFMLASVSPGARGFSRQQTRVQSRPPQRFPAALSPCARAARLPDGTGNCVQPLALRSRARLSRSSATLRPNNSSKPTPLRGAA